MQFLDARFALEGLGCALSAARLGVVLVDTKAAVLLVNDGAEQLGIGEETVRTVLKRTFAKAGASRQSELVVLLHRLLPR